MTGVSFSSSLSLTISSLTLTAMAGDSKLELSRLMVGRLTDVGARGDDEVKGAVVATGEDEVGGAVVATVGDFEGEAGVT